MPDNEIIKEVFRDVKNILTEIGNMKGDISRIDAKLTNGIAKEVTQIRTDLKELPEKCPGRIVLTDHIKDHDKEETKEKDTDKIRFEKIKFKWALRAMVGSFITAIASIIIAILK